MGASFYYFKDYYVQELDADDYCCDDGYIVFAGGDSTSHSYGNVVNIYRVFEDITNKDFPTILPEGSIVDNGSIPYIGDDLIEPAEMAELCKQVISATDDDNEYIITRFKGFLELSEQGYYIAYEKI